MFFGVQTAGGIQVDKRRELIVRSALVEALRSWRLKEEIRDSLTATMVVCLTIYRILMRSLLDFYMPGFLTLPRLIQVELADEGEIKGPLVFCWLEDGFPMC